MHVRTGAVQPHSMTRMFPQKLSFSSQLGRRNIFCPRYTFLTWPPVRLPCQRCMKNRTAKMTHMHAYNYLLHAHMQAFNVHFIFFVDCLRAKGVPDFRLKGDFWLLVLSTRFRPFHFAKAGIVSGFAKSAIRFSLPTLRQMLPFYSSSTNDPQTQVALTGPRLSVKGQSMPCCSTSRRL